MADKKNTTPSKPAPGGKKPGAPDAPGRAGQAARPLNPNNPGKKK
jgi:hypothetical protein